jgi:adenine-specific DNA-methyltransferase
MPNPRLELTWIGKENRPRLEPRILLEDPAKSHHAKHRTGKKDIFDNRLIFGDNLLALKALEHEFTGKVKCIYIDPPFNTGAAFDHYDDGLEHSIWLGLMRERLLILRNLLCPSGSVFVHLDDTEAAYCKVLLDEIFGRVNYINTIINTTNQPFGFKSTAQNIFKQANHIFLYAKSREMFNLNNSKLFIEKGYDPAYKYAMSTS